MIGQLAGILGREGGAELRLVRREREGVTMELNVY